MLTPLRLRAHIPVASLLLVFSTPGFAATPSQPSAPAPTGAMAQAGASTNGPSKPLLPDDAALKVEATRAIDAQYEKWKATLTPSQLQWERILEANLEQIIARLEKTGAKLLWATTTSVLPSSNAESYTQEQCDKVNQIADRVMKRHNIPEDDLRSTVQPRLAELQLPNNVHFKEEGYKLLAGKAASEILALLKGPNSGTPPKAGSALSLTPPWQEISS